MKILVLHGENITASRERLFNLVAQYRRKGWEIFKTDKTDELLTDTLFGQKRLYIVEKIKNIDYKSLTNKFDSNIIIWHEGNFPTTLLKKLPKITKVEKFDLPFLIYKFLDSFFPENTKNCLQILHEIILTNPPEFVLALLARHLRDLYWVKTDPETVDYPSWRVAKLKKQSNSFTIGGLKRLIIDLSDDDIKSKTSVADLATSLDLIIIKELK